MKTPQGFPYCTGHRTTSFLLIVTAVIILFGLSTIQAQPQRDSIFSKIDTVTAGSCDDLNPVLPHNAFNYTYWPSSDRLYIVFERHTAAESQIASTSYNVESG